MQKNVLRISHKRLPGINPKAMWKRENWPGSNPASCTMGSSTLPARQSRFMSQTPAFPVDCAPKTAPQKPFPSWMESQFGELNAFSAPAVSIGVRYRLSNTGKAHLKEEDMCFLKMASWKSDLILVA